MAPDDTSRPDLRRPDDDSPTGRTGVPPPDLNRTEARQGQTSGRVRWVLVGGLVLVVVLFVVAYALA